MAINHYKILLIEDDRDDYMLIKAHLDRVHGAACSLIWETGFFAGIRKIITGKFDICFIDYRLGDKTGIQLIEEIRHRRLKIPTILLTGIGDEDIGIKAIQSGAEDYLNKADITPIMLDKALRYACERYQFQQTRQAQDDLLGTAGHEIKSPLASMYATVELLERELKKHDQLSNSIHIAKLKTKINQLVELINRLLEITKLKHNGITFNTKNINLNKLIRDICLDSQQTHPNHTIKFIDKDKLKLQIDTVKFVEVVKNLIDNAVKYSPAHSQINVKLEKDNPNIKISIQDQGIGIPNDEIPKLFTKFFRSSNAQKQGIPGTGLGLYIAEEIIQQHGGRITVESKIGHGTTFTINLPMSEEIQNKPQSSKHKSKK